MVLAVATTACSRKAQFDPAAIYEDARMKLKRGEVEQARIEAEQGLQRYPYEENDWHWRFRILKAEILERQGLARESLELLAQDLPPSLAASDLPVRRNFTAALASARLQNWEAANRFLAEAESGAAVSHPELMGTVLLRKAVVRFLAGDIADSENAYHAALETARSQKDQFVEAFALGGLGLIAIKKEHYDESIDWNQASVRLARSLGIERTLGRTLGNMAWCYRKLGDFENAQQLYNQAIEVSAKNGLIADRIYWLAGLSNVFYEQHDYSSAQNILLQGLDLARSQRDNRTLAEYLNDLSEIALQTGQTEKAEKYYQEAAQIELAGLDQPGIIESLLVRGRIDQNKRNFSASKDEFAKVIADTNADQSQRWEAHARLAQVYADQGQTADTDREFRQSLQTIERVRSSVRAEDLRMSFLSGSIDFYDGYIAFLISQGRAKDALQVAQLSRARTLAEGVGMASKVLSLSSSSFYPQQIAQSAKATLLLYWLGQSKSYLWVITPAKVTYFVLPKAAEIERVVKSYRKTVLGMRDAQDASNADGKRLYGMLVVPAKKLIPQGSRVIVLPDESLYGLNFETLIAPEPQPHFWIEDVTLTTASSLTLLERSARETMSREKNLLLVGNTEQPNADFPTLPQAPAEMQRIEQYFPESQREVLEGKQATPSAYLSSNPERYAYLHFVTHGTASHTRPLESAVILSKEGDSYKLYARDIVTHHLNANLVTISACNGSGSRAYSGEGLVGLSWAFLRAGAHNVIAALWEVSDASTPQLMDALYSDLSNGKDPATALRDAKLSLLHSADAKSVFRKPFYWAPFELYVGS